MFSKFKCSVHTEIYYTLWRLNDIHHHFCLVRQFQGLCVVHAGSCNTVTASVHLFTCALLTMTSQVCSYKPSPLGGGICLFSHLLESGSDVEANTN